MTSNDSGKLQLSIKTEKEEEIKKLFLSLMDGYNDSVISPLSYFSQSEGNAGSNNETKDKARSLITRKRNLLSEYSSVLDSMVPNNLKPVKRQRSMENIVGDTVKYIKLLEDELEMLEVLKRSRMEEPAMTSCVLSRCAYQNSDKVAFTDYASTFFAIQRPVRPGLVQDIVMVLEKHQVEVLQTRFWVDEQRILTFTATIVVGIGGAGTVDRIRQEVLLL